MLSSDFRLQDEGMEALVRPHVAIGRRKELDAALKAIQAQFIAEQPRGEEDRQRSQAELQRNQRAWTTLHTRCDIVKDCIDAAEDVRSRFRAYVHVGVGGSDLGTRVCHEVLDHSLHNELPLVEGGPPRIYFAGDTFDPRPLGQLLEQLASQKVEDGQTMLSKTCFHIVSKSGKTPETLCAMLAIKAKLESSGLDWPGHTILTTQTTDSSLLYQQAKPFLDAFVKVLPYPDGVGGRFSVPCSVGLLPLALAATGEETPKSRITSALKGFAEGHERMLLPLPSCANIAFRLAAWLQQAEEALGAGSLVLYDYSNCRMLGDWLVQLYTESIQERTGGLNVIAAKGPTSNHSLLNGVICGPRDKVVLFIRWEDLGEELEVPDDPDVHPDLKVFTGKGMKALQEASLQGTITDFARNGVPAMVLTVPKRDAYNLFLVMRTLMDTVAVKGRLQQLHIDAQSKVNFPRELTYQQDGVEGYKQAMRDYLAR